MVGIFGLGYVGLTTAACLLKHGIRVEGYDISSAKRAFLARGVCPIREPGVHLSIARGLKNGTFTTAEFPSPIDLPEVIFICVGTPSAADGSTDLSHVLHVFQQLADFARNRREFKSEIILRSTVPPGTVEKLRTLHPGLFAQVPIAFYPEFLREGTAMQDFYEPSQSIVGVLPACPKPRKLPRLLKKLRISGKLAVVDAVSAESVKFASNAFHGLKVTFANEVARFVTACGGDASEVMELFRRDTKLNTSGKYLRPGNPYGGSCLPKDIRSMVHLSNQLGLRLNLIENCEASNSSHFDAIVQKIMGHHPRVIALLGVAFKMDTDDVRNSPSIELVHRLTTAGAQLIQAHDFLVDLDEAVDLNKRLQTQLLTKPTFVLNRNLNKALKGVDLIVIMHQDDRYTKAVRALDTPVLNVAAWVGFGR